MRRSISAAALALGAVMTLPALAAPVTVSYRGVVVRSSGPQAEQFAPGQAISIRYTVEPETSDTNADPNRGVFHRGLRDLRISVPAASVDVVAGPGTVQTFNDVSQGSDQAFFYGPAGSGLLGGRSVTLAEVDFIDNVAGPSGMPVMLSSDAVPTAPLVTEDSFAILTTDAGYTFVNFLVDPDAPTVAELVEDGRRVIANLVENGQLRRGAGASLSRKLESVLDASISGETARACSALRPYSRHVSALQAAGQINAATAVELGATAIALSATIGC